MSTPSLPADESRPRVALIAGPTASGKSALAVALAKACGGVVINADASQVYADLAILSARPTVQEMAGVPHRLFGYIDGAEACSAARWAADARTEIDAAHAAGRLPVLVGGTGLYLRTLLDGIAPVPDIDPQMRAAVRAMPVAAAYAALSVEDPAAAARLAPADSSRIARALEVMRSTGRPLHTWQAQRVGGIGDTVLLKPLVLLPPRDWLYQRCDLRVDAMFAAGAVEEVKALRARCLSAVLPVMRAIGVPQIGAILDGALDESAARSAVAQATRRYAKRQYTWFAHQPPETWMRYENVVQQQDIVIKLFD